MPYVLAVKFTAAPGDEERLEHWLRKHTAATQKEEGCITFLLHRDMSDPRVFWIYEQYVDKVAHEAHTKTEHFKNIAEKELQAYAAGFELIELDLLEPVG
jgi:quinol monooxygenase YgiN